MKTSGLVPAAYTPFAADGSLRLEAIDALAKLYDESQIAAVFVCGTTGESLSLTIEERMAVTERWMQAAQGRWPVIVHVGGNSLKECRQLAAHAEQHQAAAISAMAPCYFKPPLPELLEFCQQVAAAAPKTPFYFYHIPVMTGVEIDAVALLRNGVERIPTLAGIKFTSRDLATFQECLATDDGRFDVLYGHDEMLLSALVLGATGAIGSTYNYAAPVYHRLLGAFATGDLEAARHHQRQSVALVRVLLRYGVVAAGKVIMAMLGVDCGPVRSPLANLDAPQKRALFEELQSLDVFPRPLVAPD